LMAGRSNTGAAACQLKGGSEVISHFIAACESIARAIEPQSIDMSTELRLLDPSLTTEKWSRFTHFHPAHRVTMKSSTSLAGYLLNPICMSLSYALNCNRIRANSPSHGVIDRGELQTSYDPTARWVQAEEQSRPMFPNRLRRSMIARDRGTCEIDPIHRIRQTTAKSIRDTKTQSYNNFPVPHTYACQMRQKASRNSSRHRFGALRNQPERPL
jgi:hypothetical protein